MRTLTRFILPALLVLPLAACAESGAPQGAAQPAPTAEPVAFLLDSEPEGAVDVAAAKASAEEGQRIVLRGRIGGRTDPISNGQAVFVMMDPAIPTCADNPGDGCRTPWDYCCETPETIMANSATVQVVGDDGRTLTADLVDAGLAAMDEVVVVGTVGPRPSPEVLVIRAEGVFRRGG